MPRILLILPLCLLQSCSLIGPTAHLAGKATTTTLKVVGKAANAGVNALKKDPKD